MSAESARRVAQAIIRRVDAGKYGTLRVSATNGNTIILGDKAGRVYHITLEGGDAGWVANVGIRQSAVSAQPIMVETVGRDCGMERERIIWQAIEFAAKVEGWIEQIRSFSMYEEDGAGSRCAKLHLDGGYLWERQVWPRGLTFDYLWCWSRHEGRLECMDSAPLDRRADGWVSDVVAKYHLEGAPPWLR